MNNEEIKQAQEPLEQNLYNRLDDDIARKLDAMATQYSATHRKIKEALQNEKYGTLLTYDIVSDMRIYLKTDSNRFLTYFKPLNDEE